MGHQSVNRTGNADVRTKTTGTAVVRSVILEADADESDDRRGEIRTVIGGELRKTFRPREVRFVDEFSETRSRTSVREQSRPHTGEEFGDLSSGENRVP